jgi:hypothetical protein
MFFRPIEEALDHAGRKRGRDGFRSLHQLVEAAKRIVSVASEIVLFAPGAGRTTSRGRPERRAEDNEACAIPMRKKGGKNRSISLTGQRIIRIESLEVSEGAGTRTQDLRIKSPDRPYI